MTAGETTNVKSKSDVPAASPASTDGPEEAPRGPSSRSLPYKTVRGPFIRLAPHEDACDDVGQLVALAARLREEIPGVKLAADLFSGAGGISLGLENAGFKTVVAVDHYPEAVETHRHHFAGMSVDWDLGDVAKIEELAALLKAIDVDLIAGGPPCQPFSKAGRSGIRHRVRNGLRDPHDQRRDLWRSYLEVIRLVQPSAVLMENVPDMALDREMFIIRIVELQDEGVCDCWCSSYDWWSDDPCCALDCHCCTGDDLHYSALW